MSQPIETMRQQLTEQALSLTAAAAHLGWSRRTLIRALVRHGIPAICSGRRARLEMADLELLKAKNGK
jgi:excisionase family DNA binding protein